MAALAGRQVADTLGDVVRHAGLGGVHRVLAVWGADVPDEGLLCDGVFVIAGSRLATMIASFPPAASSEALGPVVAAAQERLPRVLAEHEGADALCGRCPEERRRASPGSAGCELAARIVRPRPPAFVSEPRERRRADQRGGPPTGSNAIRPPSSLRSACVTSVEGGSNVGALF